MKKCLIVCIAFALSLPPLALLGYRHYVQGIRTYDLAELQESPQVQLSIASPNAAARYAAHSQKYELLEHMEGSDWYVHTESVYNQYHHASSVWRVTVYSTYLPRYFCTMEFTSNGTWLIENSCYQNGK